MLAITTVYFLTTGIQFWITDYWVQIMSVEKSTAYIYFAVCAVTGPVAGVIFGGLVFANMGGVENPSSFSLAVVILAIGSLVCLPLPFVETIVLSAGMLWF